MPAYHSNFNKFSCKSVAKIAILPFEARFSKGSAPFWNPNDPYLKDNKCDGDIINEGLKFFKANVFFKNYEIKDNADRLLVYITLYISQCLGRLTKCRSKDDVGRELHALTSDNNFKIPGESGFPLDQHFSNPGSEADFLRDYLKQVRGEVAGRLAELVIDQSTNAPSKWWMCFHKRKFMGASLTRAGER